MSPDRNPVAVVLALAVAVIGLSPGSRLFAADAASSCDDLAGIDTTRVKAEVAEYKPREGILPGHCRVVGRVAADARVEVRLPDRWNGKFLMVGNGGYLGMFFDQSYGLARGYATASTDTGHRGGDPRFAHDNPSAEIDFAYRALHESALAARELLGIHYGSEPRYSYYRGCSTGGRQGLMEAQRFPDVFDGYSIGAPIYDYAEKQVFNAAWVTRAQFGNDRRGYVSRNLLPALRDAVYERCDHVDGLQDGIIGDPRRCDFNASEHLPVCTDDATSADCFTPAQIETITRIYDGPGGGRYPGHVAGGEWLEGGDDELVGGWDTYITGELGPGGQPVNRIGQMDRDPYGGNEFLPVQLRNAQSFFRYFAFSVDRPDFDVLTDLDFSRLPDTSHAAKLMNADSPDLRAVDARGAKMLLWHGWADVGLNPLRTIAYWEKVRALLGPERTDRFLRLFMVPGMFHCEGGPGPDIFDDLAALEGWVERDRAPQRLIAYKTRGDNDFYPHRSPQTAADREAITRSRPLCPYPLVASYRGKGSIDEASSFYCTYDAE